MQQSELRWKRLSKEKEICGIKNLQDQSQSQVEIGYLESVEAAAVFVTSFQLCTTRLKDP